MPRHFCHLSMGALDAAAWAPPMLKRHLPGRNVTTGVTLSLSSLCSRLAFFSESSSAPRPFLLFSSQGPVRNKTVQHCMNNTVVNIGSYHIAPTQPIAIIARIIKHKQIQKESTFPLPLIRRLRPPLGGLPQKKNQPLATRAKAWQAIPEVSNWVLGIIKLGYTLQFALKSPSFEPLQSVDLRPLMLKTALLLA